MRDLGEVFCPTCGTKIEKLSPEEMIDIILGMAKEVNQKTVTVLSPVVRGSQRGVLPNAV
jgi:uncharacterized Zn finger protein (UPF0148 family)